jgi:hypothetical protein
MKGEINDPTLFRRRGRFYRRVCNYHAGSGGFCRIVAKYSAIRRSKGDAIGTNPRSHLNKFKQLKETSGSVTAEFAMIMPVVVMILAFGVSLISIQASRIQLIEHAAVASRALARGESEAELLQLFADQNRIANFDVIQEKDFICVRFSIEKKIFWLGNVHLNERQCSRISGL